MPGRRRVISSPCGRLLTVAVIVSGLWSCGNTGLENRTVLKARDCSFTAFFGPVEPNEDRQVFVIGDFNGWSKGPDAMQDNDGDGLYWAKLVAPKGWHQYRIAIDDETFLDPYNPITLFDESGRENSAFFVPDCKAPLLSVEGMNVEGGYVTASVLVEAGDQGTPVSLPSGIRALVDEEVEADVRVAPGDGAKVMISAGPLKTGKHELVVDARDESGRYATPLDLWFWIEDRAFEWQDAVVYQVMVDRFRRHDSDLDSKSGQSGYHGGDLEGVEQVLEDGYFDDLGVNVLWLSPVYENPDGWFTGRDGYPSQAYHGYWPSEPDTVEERFGGDHALHELVSKAHAHGLRVILDLVLNHVHQEHPYFREHGGSGWFNETDGDCICGFSCPWSTHMETCWFDPFLPDLNWRNPAVSDRMVADAVGWIERFGADGFRLDAVPMMPRLAVRHLRRAVDAGPGASGLHVFLLGETYTSKGGQDMIQYYLGPDGLSGQFDFPVMWALRDALAGRTGMDALDKEILAGEAAWSGSGSIMGTILGNHDVPRFISDLNGDMVHDPRNHPPGKPENKAPYQLLKMAWTFVFGMTGVPVIYYGDEFGMPGGDDPDNRRDMRFGAELDEMEAEVLKHVKSVSWARACTRSLRRGTRKTLFVLPHTYVFLRDCGDGYPALVGMNSATEERRVEVLLPDDVVIAKDAGFQDVLGSVVTVSGREVTMDMGPRSSAMVVSDPKCVTR